MHRILASTLFAGAATALVALAVPALGAPVADGMPRDLTASNGAVMQTAADDGEMQTERKRETYLEETGRTLDETGKKIANSDFGEGVQNAWEKVQVQWDQLTAATAETWDDAKASFEESWGDFQQEWQKATDEDS
jgi:hypothetical protein